MQCGIDFSRTFVSDIVNEPKSMKFLQTVLIKKLLLIGLKDPHNFRLGGLAKIAPLRHHVWLFVQSRHNAYSLLQSRHNT